MCQLCFLPVFLCCHGLPKWKRGFAGTPHPFCRPLARAAPHPARSQCHVSPPSVGTHPSIGSKVRILACCSKRSPRPSLVKVGNRMLQAFPVEAWSTFAAVNQSFSEALPGGERKSSAAASSSPHLLSAWLLSHCLFSRILSARSWFAHAGRSALAANGRFAAQRLDPEGNGLQLLERHLLQRAGGRCAVNCVNHDGLGV